MKDNPTRVTLKVDVSEGLSEDAATKTQKAYEVATDAFVAKFKEELGGELEFSRVSAELCDESYLAHPRRKRPDQTKK